MHRKLLRTMGGLAAATLAALLVVGCQGAAGPNGANGTNGTNGSNGSNGSNGTNGATAVGINVASYTPDQWAALTIKGTITSATVSATAGQPVVKFKLTDTNGTPIHGFTAFTSKASTALYASYPNLSFSAAKLVAATASAPSRWVNYMVTSVPTAAAPTVWTPGRPSTEAAGVLTESWDGNYTYTFRHDLTQITSQLNAFTYTGSNVKADLGDVSFDASLVHRFTVQVSGAARGTSTNTADGSNTGITAANLLNPVNALLDVIPATGAAPATTATRDMVNMTDCNTCHGKLAFHGGSGRVEARYCVVCHTDQRKYGVANGTISGGTITGDRRMYDHAEGDFPVLIHRIHMGEGLKLQGYSYVSANEYTYPQDQRNCVKCHKNTATSPQGDNWMAKPSRFACQGCHDDVNFQTGANHGSGLNGGPQADDSLCSSCHGASGINLVHTPMVPPNPYNSYLVPVAPNNGNTNASFVAAFPSHLPPGALALSWDLSSVSLDANRAPVLKFRFLQNGARADFNTFGTKTELWDNFVGGPSVYLAFSVPQDGIARPADWNATVSAYVKTVWNGSAKVSGTTVNVGSMTGPDGSGYYTMTLSGYQVPAEAINLVGGIGYSYGLSSTQPFTQTNVPGYPYNTEGKKQGGVSVIAPNVWKNVATNPDGTAFAGRRAIVTTAKCNDCHAQLGVFTEKVFHAGQRNDAPTCTFCHNVNRTNSGWGVNIKDAVHAIHASGKRVNKFSWEASAGDKYWEVGYPGVLNNCEACHVPGSYDFSNSNNAGAVPNLLWTTVATANGSTVTANTTTVTATTPYSASGFVVVTGNETILDSLHSTTPSVVLSPFVTPGANYGAAFTTNFSATNVTAKYVNAVGSTLVNSPIVAACSNCHDTPSAINHFKQNGGAFYEARTTALSKVESCLVCHGAGKVADIKAVHMNFK